MAEPLPPSTQCYSSPTTLNLVVAAIIVLGTTASYIPQYVAIFRRKSSEGLDVIMLSIALFSSYLTATNSGILKWNLVVCCRNLSAGQCILNNLATEQLICSVFCVLILFCFFLVYFPTTPSRTHTKADRQKARKRAWVLFILPTLAGLICAVLAGVLYYNLNISSSIIGRYAEALGYMSGIGVVFQWAPQIITTVRTKDPGCLSLGMLLLQMPGALLVVFFQGVLNKAHFTTWVPYGVAAVEQTILIVIIIVLYIRKRKQAKEQTETDPLIPNLALQGGSSKSYEHP